MDILIYIISEVVISKANCSQTEQCRKQSIENIQSKSQRGKQFYNNRIK